MDKTEYTKQVLAGLSSATKTIKNFTLTNNVPTWLAEGELAVNISDKKMWVGNTLNTPILLVPSEVGVIVDGGFPSDNYSNIPIINGGTP